MTRQADAVAPSSAQIARKPDISTPSPACDADIRECLNELGNARVRTAFPDAAIGESLTGTAVALAAHESSEHAAALGQLACRVTELLKVGLSVTLDVTGAVDSTGRFEDFCHKLRRHGVPRHRRLAVLTRRSGIDLRAFALISRCYLGNGRRYVCINGNQSTGLSDAAWHQLWRTANTEWKIHIVCTDAIRSVSPLLADERAHTVLANCGLYVPMQSAWIPMSVRLTDFADERGKLDQVSLDRALKTAVYCGDRLIDLLRWITPKAAEDARCNRRLAVRIDGIGDLVARQDRDPVTFSVLRDCTDLFRHVRSVLSRHSGELAATRGLLPAIQLNDPLLRTPAGPLRAAWTRHWRDAVSRHALRNRNLLAFSPWSVLPCNGPHDRSWMDLLPLAGLADLGCFTSPKRPDCWNPLEFQRFHLRSAAEFMRLNEPSVIATRV